MTKTQHLVRSIMTSVPHQSQSRLLIFSLDHSMTWLMACFRFSGGKGLFFSIFIIKNCGSPSHFIWLYPANQDASVNSSHNLNHKKIWQENLWNPIITWVCLTQVRSGRNLAYLSFFCLQCPPFEEDWNARAKCWVKSILPANASTETTWQAVKVVIFWGRLSLSALANDSEAMRGNLISLSLVAARMHWLNAVSGRLQTMLLRALDSYLSELCAKPVRQHDPIQPRGLQPSVWVMGWITPCSWYNQTYDS